jgi:hypothetical protein
MKHKFGGLKKLAFMVGQQGSLLPSAAREPSHPPAELVSDLKVYLKAREFRTQEAT